ncbi:Uncharacterised protein [Mycobacteroides abscessus subsp. massiliense]|nr:Uncharacterised protein [Mycobacteroides abscessus subsp. massiliense]
MELGHQIVQGSVGENVRVIGQEVAIVAEVVTYSPQPLSDGRFGAGVGERDGPIGDIGLQQPHLALGQDEIVGLRFVVAKEEVLDGLSAVA